MTEVITINGGVCAPKGFKAAGIHCGIAKSATKKDLALIVSEKECTAAGVYTKNAVKSATIGVTKNNIKDGKAWGVICNSGNANACTPNGAETAEGMCRAAAGALNLSAQDFIVASTGVIGVPLDITPVQNNIGALAKSLSSNGSDDCSSAIMTTDTMKKEVAVTADINGTICTVGAVAKGSGMIHPNMGTMLCFITTDCAITSEMLKKSLTDVAENTFNMVSVDGDTSTNDTAVVLANGLAGNTVIDSQGPEFMAFTDALYYVCYTIARLMARDGEGATKLLECAVTGAATKEAARVLAKSVISSSLFKAAMFGADANWGRVLCAMGYSGAEFDPQKVDVAFSSSAGVLEVCKSGASVPFSEESAKKILSEEEIRININVNGGKASAVAWGCDLTYDYVKINGDYRS